jgi:SulP family sulfate permease
MTSSYPATPPIGRSDTLALYTPKLLTILREGYDLSAFRADMVAGLTVAIVALPLSMAIAIASGVGPERGLFTSIIGGVIVSALGGSRFQVGGPAGAFIVLVAASVARHGVEHVLVATAIAGVFLTLAGIFRLGNYIKFIPYPVTIGFTAGIAVIIFASQIKDLLGLALPGKEPADIVPKLAAFGHVLDTINPAATGLALLTIAVIAGLRKLRPRWPGMLIAVVLASGATWLLGLPVETIGSRFGGIPATLPAPGLPAMSIAGVQAALPDALSFALLGAIESLLSAVVADGMTGRRHRSNCELVAQGFANIGSAFFGGICATGLIARTATNIRAGARGPVAGMLHSLFLLLFMLLAAPLASYIPLAALAGILATVAWTMAEKQAFATLVRTSRSDAVVLLATFLLTVFRNLSEGIVVGVALGVLLFIKRMAQATDVEVQVPAVPEDRADDEGGRTPYDSRLATDDDLAVYRLSGAFFFGTAATLGAQFDQIGDGRKAYIIDFSAVPFIDSTAANAIAALGTKAKRHGVRLFISGATRAVRRALLVAGARRPQVTYRATLETAVQEARRTLAPG